MTELSVTQNPPLLPQHQKLISQSAISPEVARQRGYRSITSVADLLALGFVDYQCRVPGMLVPINDVFGENGSFAYRPDQAGKGPKYEQIEGRSLILDVPQAAFPYLGNHQVPLWITESARKADALISAGFVAVAVTGSWGWRSRNELGGLTAMPDWEKVAFKGKEGRRHIARDVILCFDSDVMTNPSVHEGVRRLGALIARRGSNVRYCLLPHPEVGKTGVDDYLGAGGTGESLVDLTVRILPTLPGTPAAPVSPLDGIISARDLVAMTFPDQRWAVPGVIPDGATLFVGSPKLGKSYLLLSTALAIAYGGKAFGQIDVEQGEVLLLCLEDNLRRLKDRLLAMTGSDEVPLGLSVHTEWPTLDEGGADYLAEWAAQHPSARMIAIDTLIKMRPPRIGNQDLYAADYRLMATIKGLADATKVAVPVVHHANRNVSADDPLDRVSGTNGLAAASDTILVMTKERGSSDANLYLRGRDVEETDYALRFDPIMGLWSIIGDATTAKMPEPRQDVVGLLTAKGALTPREIADALGKNPATIRGVCMRMFNAGQLSERSGRYYVPYPTLPTPPTPSTPSTPDDDEQISVPWGA